MKTTKKQKKAIKLLTNEGLVYCSNTKQKKNGTLYFIDPKTMVAYSITKTGYCRRHTFNNWEGENHYQLNRTTQEKMKLSKREQSQGINPWTTTGRILEPGKYVKLAKKLIRPINLWREKN